MTQSIATRSQVALIPTWIKPKLAKALRTEVPDEDDRLFNREEALRHDDAIMDFQRFGTVAWAEIKDLRGTTYVQPPARLRFALQQAQHAILRAILHHGSLFSHVRANMDGRSPQQAANASDANCASFLEARLDLFKSEDWPALIGPGSS